MIPNGILRLPEESLEETIISGRRTYRRNHWQHLHT